MWTGSGCHDAKLPGDARDQTNRLRAVVVNVSLFTIAAMTTVIPTGVVSFLFTDVEGSTRLWETDADAMGASLAFHDRIMRDAITRHNGHVFSTAGDAFAASFPTVDDAITASIQIQLGLLSADWPGPTIKVRMGIHTGTAEERGGDYFGPVLNRTARIMSAGHGGQILLSSVTAEALSSQAASSLKDLGTHHLKDLAEPEHVFEIRHPELPVVDRAIRTIDVRRTNLPDYLTSFVGRQTQLTELADLVGGNRLVSLTGVGGTGKTRLAVEAARNSSSDFPDGVWLVQLAPVTNPGFIMTTIGDTWGLRAGEGASIEDVVSRYLWSRELLLVIDNCEHLLDQASVAIKFLLDSCPNVRIVATSRESLGIPGEAQLRVPSLGLAVTGGGSEASEAELLFLDRARAVRPDFEPGPQELADVARICHRIDGIPLGLELAAARLRSMSTADLADRLDHSFRVLSGSAKTALPRQRTLQATIDWSYDLLKPPEQAMFRRLSVFTGGLDLDAAEAICIGGEVEDFEVLDHLDSLVDKSLLVPSHSESGTRYRLLEPVRQYAQEQLSETAEPEAFREAHARYFVDLVANASPGLRSPDLRPATRRIGGDYENIRSAFTTLLETGDLDRYLALVFDLFGYWAHKGMQMEAIDLARLGLSAEGDRDLNLEIKALWATGLLCAEITRPEGIDYTRRGLELAKTTNEPGLIGRMQLALGACIRHATTDPEYLEHLVEARRLLDDNPPPYWWGEQWDRGLINLLLAAYLPSGDERVLEHLTTALDLFESCGDQAFASITLSESATLYMEGDRAQDEWVLDNVRRACEIYSSFDSPNWHGHALQILGILLRYEGEPAEAAENLAQAARMLDEVGDVNCWAVSTRSLARCEAAIGKFHEAAQRLALVIDRIPVLPMQSTSKARILDSAADVLQAWHRDTQAAVILGTCLAVEGLPEDFVSVRNRELGAVREAMVDRLSEADLDRLLNEGAALTVDEALAKVRAWLRSPVATS